MRLASLIVLSTILAAGGDAHADAKNPRIGVVVQLAVNVDPARADALSAALADALNRELRVDAFGGADVARQMPEGGVPEECIGQPACVRDIAGRLDAEQLLFLVLVQVGEDTQVDASWVDVASGRTTARPRVVLAADASAVSVFADQAERYLPDAKARGGDTIILPGGPTMTPGAPRRMSVPAWIAAGVAVVGAGTGAVLGLQVRSRYAACEPVGTCEDDELDAIGQRALIADVSFAVALGGAVTAAILYLRSGEDPRPIESTTVGVVPRAGGGVLAIGGTF